MIRDPHWWRFSYIDSFSTRMQQRFAALKADREEYFDKKNLPAIQQQESAVDEMFYEIFPDEHPDAIEEQRKKWEEKAKNRKPVKAAKIKTRYYDPSAYDAGYYAAESVNLKQNKKFERKDALE